MLRIYLEFDNWDRWTLELVHEVEYMSTSFAQHLNKSVSMKIQKKKKKNKYKKKRVCKEQIGIYHYIVVRQRDVWDFESQVNMLILKTLGTTSLTHSVEPNTFTSCWE